MSWFSRSLTGLLQEKENEGVEEGGVEFWDDPELFDPAKSVKEDLSELRKSLTQSLWGVAAFLAPPPASQPAEQSPDSTPDQDQDTVSTSDVSSPKKLSGIQSDFAELKGGFAKGLSRLSSVIRGGENPEDQLEQGLSGLLKPLIENVLNDAQPDDDNVNVEDAGGDLESTKPTLPATLASHIDGISKLASSLFPFVNDDEQSDDVAEAPGLTPEVLAFATNISKHPETWLDFPLASDDHGFEMSTAQAEHAYAVERSAEALAALKVELCPVHMSEDRFWKIYFVLLHSRLSEEDAAILSTPQVLEVRSHLVNELRREQEVGENPTPEQRKESLDVKSASVDVDGSLVVDKDAIPSTVKLAASKIVDEAEADEWLAEEEASGSAKTSMLNTRFQGANDVDDVSFSDLEDDEDKSQRCPENRSQGWVELHQTDERVKKHERVGSNDWLTVDKEDAASAN